MNTKRAIRKILFVVIWVAIGSGMLTLLIAAIGRQKRENCKGYNIEINENPGAENFLDKEAVVQLLKTAVKGSIKGQPQSAFNLQELEMILEKNVWIKKTSLYFDNLAILHVSVEERQPIARIFTDEGKSFYVDKENKLLPLSEKIFSKLPVFTGFPGRKKMNKSDSVLLQNINEIAKYVHANSFWSSQIAQLDIVQGSTAGSWEFEAIPVVGNHLIRLGDAEDIDRKFNRLFSFYQQVLSRTGLNIYKTIDVRFEGQVVAGKSENPRVDSVRLRKSVESLLAQINVVSRETEEQARRDQSVLQTREASDREPAVESNRSGQADKENKLNTQSDERVPKAVMPGRDDQ